MLSCKLVETTTYPRGANIDTIVGTRHTLPAHLKHISPTLDVNSPLQRKNHHSGQLKIMW